MLRHRSRRAVTAGTALTLLITTLAWTPVIGPRPVAAAAPTPVARWTFDEGSGSTAGDSVGSLDGSLSGGTSWITSGAPQGTGAVAFDGVDDAITIPSSPTLEPTSFTLTMWLKGTDRDPATARVVLQKGFYGCDIGSSWSVNATGDGVMGEVYDADWPNANGTVTNVPSAWDGAWHRYAMVFDGPAGTMTEWLDGHKAPIDFQSAVDLQYGASGRLDDHLRIGGPGASCPYRPAYLGAIDDLTLYSSAMSDAEVMALMPVFPTSTTVEVGQGSPTDSVYGDAEWGLGAYVTPTPVAGDMEFHLSKDGGPESLYATKPLVNGGTYSGLLVPAGTLGAGSYTVRAKWVGDDHWLPSTSAAIAFTVLRRPVELNLTASPDADIPGGGSTLKAMIRKINPPYGLESVPGSVEFHDVTDGGDTVVGSSALTWAGDGWLQGSVAVSGLSDGVHSYQARYAGTDVVSSASASATVTIGTQGSATWITVAPNPVKATSTSVATVGLSTWRKTQASGTVVSLPRPTGTLTLKRASTGAVLGSTPVTTDSQYQFDLPSFTIGTVGLVVEYSGDANYDSAVSEPYNLVVVPDTVDATGIGLGYSSFYPYKDGYRDTLPIAGNRLELASVDIRVYSSAGKLVKSFAIPMGGGVYSVAWNGRWSTGAMLPAGTYRVVQTLTDAQGTKLAVAKTVALSGKRLYTYSKTLNLTTATKKTSSWAAWTFTLPSAPVYRTLKAQVYGRSTAVPGALIGAQDSRQCGYSSNYDPSCVGSWTTMTYTTAWQTKSLSATYNRYGTHVRVFAMAQGRGVVYKARLIVTYALLK